MNPRCLIWVNVPERWYSFHFIVYDSEVNAIIGRDVIGLFRTNNCIIFNGEWQSTRPTVNYRLRWISVGVQTLWRDRGTQIAYLEPVGDVNNLEGFFVAYRALRRKRKGGQLFECRTDDDILTKILGCCAVPSPPDTDTERIECAD